MRRSGRRASPAVQAFTYDAFGRVTRTNFPSSLSENYQYDADNNLTQKTDRKNQTITYLYDTLNRLTSLAPPSAFGSGSFRFPSDAPSRPPHTNQPNSVTP